MFKSERLLHKWFGDKILKPMGNVGSAIMGLAGRTTKRVEAGSETAVVDSSGAIENTLNEATEATLLGFRGIMRNILAPITVLDSDKSFKEKTKSIFSELWHSTIKGTAKSLAVGIGDPILTTAGVDVSKDTFLKRRKGRGILGLAGKLLGGTGRILSGPFVKETPDPAKEAAAEKKEQHERMEARRKWIMPKHQQ